MTLTAAPLPDAAAEPGAAAESGARPAALPAPFPEPVVAPEPWPTTVGGFAVPGPLVGSPLGRLLARLRTAHLAALTVLLVCWPASDKDVTAAVHVTAADLGSLGLVAVAALEAAVAVRRGAGRLLPRRPVLLFGGALLALAAATVASQDPAQSLSGFVREAQVFVLVPLAVLLAVRDHRDQRLVLRAFVAAAVIEGGYGTFQYVTGTGASYEGVTQRAVGTFGAQDIMAMSVVVSYGLLAALACALRARRAGERRSAALYGGTAVALLVPLALSFSRGSWIATAVAACSVLALAELRLLLKTLLFGAAAAVVLVGGLGLGGSAVSARLTSIGSVAGAGVDHSVTDRYDLWTTAERIWADHPVTGVGPKEFPAFRDAHAPLRLSSGSDTDGAGTTGFAKEPLLSPHNMYLLLLSEQGLIGLTAFAALFLGLLVGAVRGAARGSAAGFALLLWQLVDFLYGDIGGTTTVLISVVLGLAAVAGRDALAGRAAPTGPGAGAATTRAEGGPAWH